MSVVMPRLFRTFQDAFFDTFYKQLTFFKRWFVVVVVFIWNVIPIRIERHDAETSVSQFIPNITITLMRKPHLVEKEYHMPLPSVNFSGIRLIEPDLIACCRLYVKRFISRCSANRCSSVKHSTGIAELMRVIYLICLLYD